MRKLYYATFEKGFGEVVKAVIKKIDKNAKIKILYEESVLFFADEHFSFKDKCFFEAYICLFNMGKKGVGSINQTIKALLEKRDFKIRLSKDVPALKLTIKSENENVLVDAKLKSAFEVMLKKSTHRGLSMFAKDELVLLSKKDGENLFMLKIDSSNSFDKFRNKFELMPETAYLLNFLSNPAKNEVIIDAFAKNGAICYTRAANFAKANVIASNAEKDICDILRKQAKALKEKSYSVLNYDFLDDRFPIRFIDKIITDLTDLAYQKGNKLQEFFDRCFAFKVDTIIIFVSKNVEIETKFVEKYKIIEKFAATRNFVYKLKITQ